MDLCSASRMHTFFSLLWGFQAWDKHPVAQNNIPLALADFDLMLSLELGFSLASAHFWLQLSSAQLPP